MPFDAVHPAWTRSKERFFDRENFLRLIGHYEILGWGFQGVDVFSHEGQILTVEFALPMVPTFDADLLPTRVRVAHVRILLSTSRLPLTRSAPTHTGGTAKCLQDQADLADR
jgi:hypothetical protein